MYFDLSLFEVNDVRVVNRKDRKTGNRIISDKTVAEEFYNFFYSNGLAPLFTNEHRAQPIQISLIQAQEIIKSGSRLNRIFSEFGSNYLSKGMDNKSYEQAVFKIIYEARDLKSLVRIVEDHINYIDGILDNYLHNTWNIVWYDKDKSGTKVSKGL